MARPGYQDGGEPWWWWKVAQHLDAAQLALVNAMAHNLDDQTTVFALQDKLREGQGILLEIFRAKGLLPSGPRGGAVVPPSPAVISQPPGTLPPGVVSLPVTAPVTEDPEGSTVIAVPPECVEAAPMNGRASADQEAAVYELVAEVLPATGTVAVSVEERQ